MLTIKEVSNRTGRSPDVLRAWERRYGVVQPERSAAGYRLYDESDIERLLAMGRLVDSGLKPQEAASQLASQAAPNGSRPPSATGVSSSVERQQLSPAPAQAPSPGERLIHAAANLSTSSLSAYFDELSSLGTFETICDERLFPDFRALGGAWSSGRLSVAAEHAASAAALRWLGTQYQAAATDSGSPQVLVGLPSGAYHELGALAHAVALRRRGIAALYLGPNLPLEDWLAAVRVTGVTLVVLGVVLQRDVQPVEKVATSLEAASPDLRLAFGGPRSGLLAQHGLVLPGSLGAAQEAVAELVAGTATTGA